MTIDIDLEPQNFDVRAGDAFDLKVTVRNKAQVPIDVSAVSAAEWKISRGNLHRFNATPLITKTIGTGIDDALAAQGLLVVSVASSDVAGMLKDHYHQMRLQFGVNWFTVMRGVGFFDPTL